MIIAISGKKGSGKDLVAKIIQYLTSDIYLGGQPTSIEFLNSFNKGLHTKFEVKRFADKLKDMVCILLGCTREQLEDREFKEKELGEEWWAYSVKSQYDTYLFNTYQEALDSHGGYYKPNIVKLTPRKILQLLGTEAGRNIIHPNIWVNALMSEYKSRDPNNKWGTTHDKPFLDSYICHCSSCKKAFPSPNKRAFVCNDCWDDYHWFPNWIIPDMRFPNELSAVESKGGITIRVERPSIKSDDNHESETALDNAEFDYIIENTGTIDDLVDMVKQLLQSEKIIE